MKVENLDHLAFLAFNDKSVGTTNENFVIGMNRWENFLAELFVFVSKLPLIIFEFHFFVFLNNIFWNFKFFFVGHIQLIL